MEKPHELTVIEVEGIPFLVYFMWNNKLEQARMRRGAHSDTIPMIIRDRNMLLPVEWKGLHGTR